ncbi:polysaccharide deacetylase family protein [Cohnella lubricantis]|uniref:Polysaccharide deacetylase family protein n=1 Tax=Cohnella lubricantis TaxID=2163172 RepID=A0A841T8Z7_9BACL|nr:polysaccharide deacetylase family protein [Cohnella lubricantis]MBB6676549.1 polysaccharide deacetylase family protein [Cohnella lubricantis]MBP2117440.1 putative sporulation protein (polysaccharide deacetylase family) [Cohnella lubricantis]
MRKASPARLAAIVIVFAALLAAGRYGPLEAYIHTVKQHVTASANAFRTGSGPELLEWIQSEAPKRRIEPKNAVIDRVWKAIPGYNGREVDIEATYAQARAIGAKPGAGDSFPWVYKEVSPRIGLDDLPASPIYRGNPDKPMVGLMINVAWGNEHLKPILDTLREEKVSATFFFDGSWLNKNADLAQEIVRQGHEASNHAYTHPNMSSLGVARQRQEIERTEALLKTKLGVTNRWFAPPSGDYNEQTIRAASDYGLKTVMWTLDTVDWKNPPASSVITKVRARVQAGTLILMHPTQTTEESLGEIIRLIRSKGLVPGTVSETLSAKRLDLPEKR